MLTKQDVLDRATREWQTLDVADWRNHTDNTVLVARLANERAALFIAATSIVRCDDLTLTSLALEASKLAPTGHTDALQVVPMLSSEARDYRDAPIDKYGALRFSNKLEVGCVLDGFRGDVEAVLCGQRGSLWENGSDDLGFPSGADLISKIRSGRYSAGVIWMLGRFPGAETLQLLAELTESSSPKETAQALSVTVRLGQPLNTVLAGQLASDITDIQTASMAEVLLARAAAAGDSLALDKLFDLTRREEWNRAMDFPWRDADIKSREHLSQAVRREYTRRPKNER